MIIKDCMTKNELDRAVNKVLFGAHGNWKGWKQLILLSQCGNYLLKYSTKQIFQYIACYGLSAPQKYNSTVGLWSQQEHVGGIYHEKKRVQENHKN